jgi:hypothetical protein
MKLIIEFWVEKNAIYITLIFFVVTKFCYNNYKKRNNNFIVVFFKASILVAENSFDFLLINVSQFIIKARN